MRKLALLSPALLVCLALTSCGGSSDAADPSPEQSPTEVTTEAAPELVEAPIVLPLPLSFAEDRNPDVRFDETDLGEHLVDGVDHQRSVWDNANWRIIAQCDQVEDGTLKVGVIKTEEFEVISGAGQGSSVAENAHKVLLDCPGD